ncbi:MAG: 4'-phosphopantetheinyl transferase superfamily protein [Pseudohongiellaceae bacterium]
MINLTDNEVHLWVLRTAPKETSDHAACAALAEAGNGFLDANEKAHLLRFRSQGQRRAYLLTRILVRFALSRYAGNIAPAEFRFSDNQHGKPFITEPSLSDPLFFNVSHSGAMTAVAIGRVREIGLDIQQIDDRTGLLDLARRYFTPLEYSRLQSLDGAQLSAGFFSLWTLKEAYSKALGTALTGTLKKISFSFPHDGEIRADFVADATEKRLAWWFCQVDAGPDYSAALAVGEPAQTGQQLTHRNIRIVRWELLALDRVEERDAGIIASSAR